MTSGPKRLKSDEDLEKIKKTKVDHQQDEWTSCQYECDLENRKSKTETGGRGEKRPISSRGFGRLRNDDDADEYFNIERLNFFKLLKLMFREIVLELLISQLISFPNHYEQYTS